ncbi:MAG: hypothetical protein AMJ60_07625 [Desulfobacterales bacterium SG8_35]|nr:MAG: hypothetical protein AMJ60_07625 [Desulfobacterales bacterium SG8_35]
MTAAAFYRCIPAFIIHLLMAILAHFMSCLLVAVDISIADVRGMTVGAFINYHDLILGMMAGGAGIVLLMLAMRKISRFSCRFGLQSYIGRPYADLNSESTTGY